MDVCVFGHNVHAIITIDERESVFERAVWRQLIATMSVLNWNLATCLMVENCCSNSAWDTIGLVVNERLRFLSQWHECIGNGFIIRQFRLFS